MRPRKWDRAELLQAAIFSAFPEDFQCGEWSIDQVM
jgi:hypothetical protein